MFVNVKAYKIQASLKNCIYLPQKSCHNFLEKDEIVYKKYVASLNWTKNLSSQIDPLLILGIRKQIKNEGLKEVDFERILAEKRK